MMAVAAVFGLISVLMVATLEPTGCRCAQVRIADGWCVPCKVGYVASVPIKSVLLFEVLDAHGHDIDIKAIPCATCKRAYEADGFCDPCRRGFVRKQAYLSRLTYHLAKGERTDPAKLGCEACRKHAAGCGWCEKCGVGMVGPVAIRAKDEFEQAKSAYELMRSAVAMAERCELCAAAMITDGYCPDCKVTYRNGQRVEAENR